MLNGEGERGEMGTVVGICGELPGWGREASEEEREGMTGAMKCCWCERGLGTRTVSSAGSHSSADGLGMVREGSRRWRGVERGTAGWAKEAWCADMASWHEIRRKGGRWMG